ncbi:MAG: STAS domain-containing protein [Clostridia bacterium]|nr:STAS domain-containing protein [Clostridia bacterium]
MTIEKNVLGNTVELKLSGWLDTQTTPQLEAEVNALDEDVSALALDFADLEYISSAGLRQIVAAYKKMKGALTLRHVSDEIMNVISMTGLDKRIKIE